jgi:hypothetical protein
LIEELLVVNPNKRIPLVGIFNHPWVLEFEAQINPVQRPLKMSNNLESSGPISKPKMLGMKPIAIRHQDRQSIAYEDDQSDGSYE